MPPDYCEQTEIDGQIETSNDLGGELVDKVQHPCGPGLGVRGHKHVPCRALPKDLQNLDDHGCVVPRAAVLFTQYPPASAPPPLCGWGWDKLLWEEEGLGGGGGGGLGLPVRWGGRAPDPLLRPSLPEQKKNPSGFREIFSSPSVFPSGSMFCKGFLILSSGNPLHGCVHPWRRFGFPKPVFLTCAFWVTSNMAWKLNRSFKPPKNWHHLALFCRSLHEQSCRGEKCEFIYFILI